jgi:rod shape-determining protein MreC
VRASGWLGESLSSREHLLTENARQRERGLLQAARLQRLEALERENRRLRELLSASERVDDRVSVAELLAVALDPYRQEVVLDRGTRDGVFVGQPVIDAYGIIGQVRQVDPLSAHVLLISDPSHALPVLINRTGLRTLAVGTGSPDLLELRHIPPSADVRVGDIVSSSGLGQRFPRDYPVAEISRVERTPGAHFAIVEARPLARLDRSREVLLVWSAETTSPGDDAATGEAADAQAGAGP